jgi:hypothetical protein
VAGRRLDAARVFAEIWTLYRRGAAVLLPTALAIYFVIAVLQAIILTGKANVFVTVLTLGLSVIGGFWYTGLVTEYVRAVRETGGSRSIGEMFSAIQPRFYALLGIGLLAGAGIVVGLILFVIPGLYLLTMWALVIPVLLIERGPAMDSFSRSMALVRGNGFRVFGVFVVILLINGVLGQLVTAIGGNSFAALLALALAVSVVVAPLQGLAAAIMYFDLRALGDRAPAY